MQQLEHPDHHPDYRVLKDLQRGGRQAITTSAMNAMYDALDEGKSKEEAERIYFSFFNTKNHDRQTSFPLRDT